MDNVGGRQDWGTSAQLRAPSRLILA